MNNVQIIEVSYLSATDYEPTRIKLYSHLNDDSVIINYDYALNNIAEIAEQYLNEKGIEVQNKGSKEDGYFLTCETSKRITE